MVPDPRVVQFLSNSEADTLDLTSINKEEEESELGEQLKKQQQKHEKVAEALANQQENRIENQDSANQIKSDGNPENFQIKKDVTKETKPEKNVKLEFEGTIVTKAIKSMKEALKYHRHIKRLILANCHIGDSGLKELSEGIKENTSITELNISGNWITDNGMIQNFINNGLSANRSLQDIDLSDNQISDETINDLYHILISEKTTIKRLNLSKNMITDAGAEKFAEALKKLNTFEKIELEKNQIGDKGATAISEIFKIPNCKITHVYLGYNNIGNEGARSIAKAVEGNKNIKSLNLEFNNISYKGNKELAFMVVKNKFLEDRKRVV